MARIKCRYTKPRCALGNNKECGGDCFETWGGCESYRAPGKHWRDERTIVIDDRCENVYFARIEFEKNYKEYEYDGSDGLSLGRRGYFIPIDDIKYLEIDDRILINEEVKP